MFKVRMNLTGITLAVLAGWALIEGNTMEAAILISASGIADVIWSGLSK